MSEDEVLHAQELLAELSRRANFVEEPAQQLLNQGWESVFTFRPFEADGKINAGDIDLALKKVPKTNEGLNGAQFCVAKDITDLQGRIFLLLKKEEQQKIKLDPEAQRMIDEAEQLANSVLSQMSLKQLYYFNGYLHKVKDDYHAQETLWRNRSYGEEVDFPRYKKLPGAETADWWPLVETLFNEDGGQFMSGLVEMFVERFIHEKARANPGYVPEEEYPDVQHVAFSVAVQEAEEGTKLDLIGWQIKDENDPKQVEELGQKAAAQKEVVNQLTKLRSALEAKPVDFQE